MSVRVEHIYIKLDDYKFCAETNPIYIGREEAHKNLFKRLNPRGSNYKGAYLISGYRGMGKTTLAEQVVNDVNKSKSTTGRFNKPKDEVIDIRINLAQGNLTDYDLLMQIFTQFSLQYKKKIQKNYFPIGIPFIAFCYLIIALVLKNTTDHFDYFFFIRQNENLSNINYVNSSSPIDLIGLLIFSLFFILITVLTKQFISRLYQFLFPKRNRFQNKVFAIEQRLNSSLEIGNGSFPNENFTGMTSGGPILNKVVSIVSNKQQSPFKQSFEKFSAKELENEIKEMLDLFDEFQKSDFISKLGTRKRILFIIDELDKLETELSQSSIYSIDNQESGSNSRKQIISKVLASLKNFINTANAKFVFIGGAEMYEASLADVADRESFYSSIFHEVIYIDTFFKDFDSKKEGLPQMVENYLVRVILEKKRIRSNSHFNLKQLKELFIKSGIEDEKREYILYHLYRFIIYLTYRCNGSPKKLKELIEYYIVYDHIVKDKRATVIKSNGDFYTAISNNFYENWIKNKNNLGNSNIIQGTFLKFNYQQLYKVGLLSSIYLPYIVNNQKHQKIFNDKNLYLNAFLIDHILKFHRSAFSWRELELMPDIILGSRGPNLRETLKHTLNYLSKVHIRETSNTMFQYKFRSRTEMELRYISKISDESAAAYNFTFDESYHLKAFFKNKLKQRIKNYSVLPNKYDSSEFNHTFGYLNSTIGDIHFFDEEYDSAIRYYADTIQNLRKSINKLTNHQKILLVRNRLSLSLCLEKTNRYESAYSILRSTLIDLKQTIFNQDKSDDTWEEAYKRMQLFLRPHIALLMIIEKERSDGITASNLKRNIKEYTDFMGVVSLFPSEKFQKKLGFRDFIPDKNGDHKRVQTLLADYYQNVGSILFFKNRNFKSILEECLSDILEDYLNVKDIPGLSILHFRENYSKGQYENYYPSLLPFFYYIISAGHLVTPYLENIDTLFGLQHGQDLKTSSIIEILDKLAFDFSLNHVLNGKQKTSIGLICSKISDCILSSLGNVRLDESLKNKNTNAEIDPLFGSNGFKADKWHIKNTKGIIHFNALFSMNSVFYFNILSYKFFYGAGRYYDALLSLKKCLYIVKTHLLRAEKNENGVKVYINNFHRKFIQKFSKRLAEGCEDLINEEGLGVLKKDKNYFNDISKKKSQYYGYSKYSDSKEVFFLENYIRIETSLMIGNRKLINRIWKSLQKEKNILDNVFTRVQKLRIHAFIHYKYHEPFFKMIKNGEFISIQLDQNNKNLICTYKDGSIATNDKISNYLDLEYSIKEVDICFRNLDNILKTYGYTYIMTYSYSGSLYQNISKWVEVIKGIDDLLGDNILSKLWRDIEDVNSYKVKANEFFKKAIRLHSGGDEYKEMIKDFYILEDDQNDGLSHFCAALERSIINTGRLDSKRKKDSQKYRGVNFYESSIT